MPKLPTLGVEAESLYFSVFLSVCLISHLSLPTPLGPGPLQLLCCRGGSRVLIGVSPGKTMPKVTASLAALLKPQGMDTKPCLESTG